MRMVVLGGTGTMGRLVMQRLRAAGDHEVVPASRASGVDVRTGAGLATAFRDTEVVIDCTNAFALQAKAAVALLGGMAGRVVSAAEQAGVRHLVLLSILNAGAPGLEKMGYFQGKLAQERAVTDSPVPSTVLATAQWYELAQTFLDQTRVGPVSLVPHYRCAAMAAASAADVLAEVALGASTGRREVAGPEALDLYDVARSLAHRQGRRVLPLPVPGATRALAGGVLLPGPGVPRVGPTVAQWLAAR